MDKIRAMKNPTIHMNQNDFDVWSKELQSKVQNFKVGEKPTYKGIPVKISNILETGTIVVLDDVPKSWYQEQTEGYLNEWRKEESKIHKLMLGKLNLFNNRPVSESDLRRIWEIEKQAGE